MAEEDYKSHIELVDSSFSRMSTVGRSFDSASTSELEALSELETILRFGTLPDGVLSDMQNRSFSGSFITLFQKNVFNAFLEYKKVSLEMTLDGFLKDEQYKQYRPEILDPEVEEYSDSSDVDESAYLEPEENNGRITAGGLTVEELAEVLDAKWSEPYTLPLSVDADGFDIWTIPDLDFSDEEDLAKDFNFEALDDEEMELDILFTEPLGIDEDGFDIWGIEEEPEVVEEDPLGELLTEPFGTDEDGHDVWCDPKKAIKEDFDVPTDSDDGWDHSEDEDRKGLGELKSTWQGADEDGFDIWVEPSDEGPSIEDVLTEDGKLGILNTTPYGVDEDGFDQWEAPVSASEPTSASAVTPSPGTVATPTRTGTPAGHFSPLQNSSRKMSSEDKTAELLIKSADQVGKLGKKFLRFMTR